MILSHRAQHRGEDVEQQLNLFWCSLAAVLHLGEVSFVEVPHPSGSPASSLAEGALEHLQRVASLLGCSADELQTVLCNRRFRAVRGDDKPNEKPRRAKEAEAARDTLAKAVYQRLFNKLMAEVNAALDFSEPVTVGRMQSDSAASSRYDVGGTTNRASRSLFIGLLDIFGSEVFKVNSFEQLLINYANDKLQHYFTKTAIDLVIRLYEDENIDTTYVRNERHDIEPTLVMLEGIANNPKQVSLFSLLNDDQLFNASTFDKFGAGSSRDSALLERMKADKPAGIGKMMGFVDERGRAWDGAEESYDRKPRFDKSRFTMPVDFGVSHFGSTVAYRVEGFSDKNADLLDRELWELLHSASAGGADGRSGFSRELFCDDRSQHRSVSANFLEQMRALVTTLEGCKGHFIRCIKPNDKREPFSLDEGMTAAQLQSCGVLEAARVSQAGYPKRVRYQEFFNHFMGRHALRRTRHNGRLDMPKLCKTLALKVLGIKEGVDFVLGTTMIFLRAGVLMRCNAEHERRLKVIGRRMDPGQHTTGLRGLRVQRNFSRLTDEVERKLKDKAFREKLKKDRLAQQRNEEQDREAAAREQQEQLERLAAAEKAAAAAEAAAVEAATRAEEQKAAMEELAKKQKAAMESFDDERQRRELMESQSAAAREEAAKEVESVKAAMHAKEEAFTVREQKAALEHAKALDSAREEKVAALREAQQRFDEQLTREREEAALKMKTALDNAHAQKESELDEAAKEKSEIESELQKVRSERDELESTLRQAGEQMERDQSALQKGREDLSQLVKNCDEMKEKLASEEEEHEKTQHEKTQQARAQQQQAEDLAVGLMQQEIEFLEGAQNYYRGTDDGKERCDMISKDAEYWYWRGFRLNPTIEAGESLKPLQRAHTKAARALMMRAAKLVKEDLDCPVQTLPRPALAPQRSSPQRSSLFGSFSGDPRRASGVFDTRSGADLTPDEKLRHTLFKYQVSAANMTKKLDASAALAEYERIMAGLDEEKQSEQNDKNKKKLVGFREGAEKSVSGRLKLQLSKCTEAATDTRVQRAACKPVQGYKMALKKVDIDKIGFYYADGGYEVHLGADALSRVKAAGYKNSGRTTPMKPITLDSDAKQKADIPQDATMFAYVFPLDGRQLTFTPETAEEEAMLHGAFAYFHNADSLAALKAVCIVGEGLSSSISFSGPHMLHAPAAAAGGGGSLPPPASLPQPPGGASPNTPIVDGAKMRDFLISSGRVHPVTIAALRDYGVEKFWWLGPGEKIAQEEGGAWVHGSFVYLYCEEARESDCFLAVEA